MLRWWDPVKEGMVPVRGRRQTDWQVRSYVGPYLIRTETNKRLWSPVRRGFEPTVVPQTEGWSYGKRTNSGLLDVVRPRDYLWTEWVTPRLKDMTQRGWRPPTGKIGRTRDCGECPGGETTLQCKWWDPTGVHNKQTSGTNPTTGRTRGRNWNEL